MPAGFGERFGLDDLVALAVGAAGVAVIALWRRWIRAVDNNLADFGDD